MKTRRSSLPLCVVGCGGSSRQRPTTPRHRLADGDTATTDGGNPRPTPPPPHRSRCSIGSAGCRRSPRWSTSSSIARPRIRGSRIGSSTPTPSTSRSCSPSSCAGDRRSVQVHRTRHGDLARRHGSRRRRVHRAGREPRRRARQVQGAGQGEGRAPRRARSAQAADRGAGRQASSRSTTRSSTR